MPTLVRGADIVARTLDAAGLTTIFTLSGNHIMPLFDAAIGTRLRLIHVRHEAAAVHMADAWGRLTGQCGIVWVSGGAGFTNAAAALCTAQAGESPLVLLSGHAGVEGSRARRLPGTAPGRHGRAGHQGLVDRALRGDARARTSPRRCASRCPAGPGPVHLSLPFDLLEETVEDAPALWPPRSALLRRPKRSIDARPLPSLPRSPRRSVLSFSPGRSSAMAAILRCSTASGISSAFRSCRWKVRAASTIRASAPSPKSCARRT